MSETLDTVAFVRFLWFSCRVQRSPFAQIPTKANNGKLVAKIWHKFVANFGYNWEAEKETTNEISSNK